MTCDCLPDADCEDGWRKHQAMLNTKYPNTVLYGLSYRDGFCAAWHLRDEDVRARTEIYAHPDKRIEELEAQLAEKEREFSDYKRGQLWMAKRLVNAGENAHDRIRELKKQLMEKELKDAFANWNHEVILVAGKNVELRTGEVRKEQLGDKGITSPSPSPEDVQNGLKADKTEVGSSHASQDFNPSASNHEHICCTAPLKAEIENLKIKLTKWGAEEVEDIGTLMCRNGSVTCRLLTALEGKEKCLKCKKEEEVFGTDGEK